VEREGVSLRYPFKPILIGTFCPDGGDLSDFFLDKVGNLGSLERGVWVVGWCVWWVWW
jgi:Mg-chelatase subunit ChlI